MNFIILVTLPLLGFLVYSNSFLNSFHLDDFPSIVINDPIRNLFDLHHIWAFWPTRFVTYYSFALNYHWGGLNLYGYHIFSLLIHVMCAVLVWRFMLQILNQKIIKDEIPSDQVTWIAFFTAAIFLVHPLQTQAINYIVQRAVILAAFFYIAALVLYTQAHGAWKSKPYSKMGMFYYLLSLISAILSMLSKENAVSLPFMICFYQWFILGGLKSSQWKKVLPFFLSLLVIPLAWGRLNLHDLMGIGQSVDGFSQGMMVHQYAITQAKVVLTYLKLLMLPFHLRVEYDFALASFDLSVIGSIILLLLILGFAVYIRKRSKLMAFGISWFFITLMPESSFWPIKDLIFEHRMYLPLLGFSIFLSSGAFYFFSQKSSIAVKVLFIFLLTFCFLTYQRNKVWRDEFTLWDDAVHRSPKSVRAYLNRGSAYQERGDLDHALADYNMVIGLGPIDPITLSNRGLIFEKKGRFDLALANYNLAIKINPSFAGTYCNRGLLYEKEGKVDLALADFNQAALMIHHDPSVYFNQGMLNRQKGNFDEAIIDFNKAIELLPQDTHLYELRAETYYLKKVAGKH